MEIEDGNGRFLNELRGGRYNRSETRQHAAGHQVIFGISTNRGLVVLPFASKKLIGIESTVPPCPLPRVHYESARQILARARSGEAMAKMSHFQGEGVSPTRLRLLQTELAARLRCRLVSKSAIGEKLSFIALRESERPRSAKSLRKSKSPLQLR